MEKNRPLCVLLGCAALLLVSLALSLCLGAVRLSPAQLLEGVLDASTVSGRILWHTRLPRMLATLFAGCALAASGVLIQTVLGNPLAGPNIIGVNAGAGFAVALLSAFTPLTATLTPMAAFLGALAAMLLVYFAARATGASRVTLVLAGVAVASLLNAGTDAVVTLIPDALPGSSSFRIGGVEGASMVQLRPAMVYIVLGLLAAFALRPAMDVLALGDETAQSLGLRVEPVRFALLLTAALLAGAAVSFAGLIGFVGLIVPHAARALLGGRGKLLLPTATLLGGAFLTLCDVLGRVIFAPYELPVGIVLSFIGCPFFLFLLARRKGGHARDRA